MNIFLTLVYAEVYAKLQCHLGFGYAGVVKGHQVIGNKILREIHLTSCGVTVQ
jgi:hypothetical protein